MNLARSFVPFLRFALVFSVLCAARAPLAHAQATPPPPEILEPPRIGIVFKGGAAAAKARTEWRSALATHECRPEIVVLDALPASAAKSKTPVPRWVVVYEEAKSAATGATTEEYEDDLGRTSRIRYRGSTAQGRARIFEVRDKPVEIAVLHESIDETKPPDKARFAAGESKKEVVIDPEDLLDRMLARVAGRTLSLGAAIDLWRERTRLVELAARFEPAQSAEFWRRSASVALDPMYCTAPVPWHSLETAALDLWKRAPAAAARFPRPATTCAWCDRPPPGEGETCACPETNALAHALVVLSATLDRANPDGLRKDALEIEVARADLDPSRPAKWKDALKSLTKRMDAEQAADRARLAHRLELDPQKKTAWGFMTYVILVPQSAVEWKPSEPDLLRHASELVQVFTIGSNTAGTYFGVDAARATISLARWDPKTRWYEAVGRREFKGTDALDALLLRALWDNARGEDGEPPR